MRQIFKNSILILSLTFSSVLYGQNDYINVRNLPIPDCSGESSIYSKFNWGNKERLLIIPDKTSESEDFSHIFKYYKRSVHDSLIKRESELSI